MREKKTSGAPDQPLADMNNTKKSKEVSGQAKKAKKEPENDPTDDFGGLQGAENFRRNMGCGG